MAIFDCYIDKYIDKFNMMYTEVFQLRDKFELTDENIQDNKYLVMVILKQIKEGEITSPHFNKQEAEEALKILKLLDETGNKTKCICANNKLDPVKRCKCNGA